MTLVATPTSNSNGHSQPIARLPAPARPRSHQAITSGKVRMATPKCLANQTCRATLTWTDRSWPKFESADSTVKPSGNTMRPIRAKGIRSRRRTRASPTGFGQPIQCAHASVQPNAATAMTGPTTNWMGSYEASQARTIQPSVVTTKQPASTHRSRLSMAMASNMPACRCRSEALSSFAPITSSV